MNRATTVVAFYGLLAASVALVRCGDLPILRTQALPIREIKIPEIVATLPPDGIFAIPVIEIEGDQDLPIDLETINVQQLAIRSLLADDGSAAAKTDRSEDGRKNESSVSTCATGRARLGFISTLTVKIRGSQQPASQAKTLATYDRGDGDPNAELCGIFMNVDEDVDMEPYLDGYVITIEGTANPPKDPTDFDISGFITFAGLLIDL